MWCGRDLRLPSVTSVVAPFTADHGTGRRFRHRIEGVKCGLRRSTIGVILRVTFLVASERSHVRPSFARAPWLVSGFFTLAVFLIPRSAAAQFVSLPGNPRNILEGNWQSCQELGSSGYTERVYDHVVNGVGQYEVHLGPRREFAIFKGVQDEHRPHNVPDNLLKPFQVAMQGTRARQRWEIPSLNIAFTVALGGGSRSDCESWYILLEPIEKTSD